MTLKDDAINLHRILKGKIEIKSKVFTDGALDGKNDTLSLIYTPGVDKSKQIPSLRIYIQME